jgi:hypothetical protein
MKTWFKNFFAKIGTGITTLYGNSWFIGLSVLALGLMIYMIPVIGGFVWVLWLAGWAFLAKK